jgi:hypothetical protein
MKTRSYTAVDVLNLARDLREDAYIHGPRGHIGAGVTVEPSNHLIDYIGAANALLLAAEVAINARDPGDLAKVLEEVELGG